LVSNASPSIVGTCTTKIDDDLERSQVIKELRTRHQLAVKLNSNRNLLLIAFLSLFILFGSLIVD
jgi:hypothetical protein